MIDETLYQYPRCPNCNKTLSTVTSNIVLTSYPPYYCFKCEHCEFKGFVMLELSEERKKEMGPITGVRFSKEFAILNPEFLPNIKVNDDKTNH